MKKTGDTSDFVKTSVIRKLCSLFRDKIKAAIQRDIQSFPLSNYMHFIAYALQQRL